MLYEVITQSIPAPGTRIRSSSPRFEEDFGATVGKPQGIGGPIMNQAQFVTLADAAAAVPSGAKIAIGGAMVMSPMAFVRDRITSYNVCYTKLLRRLLSNVQPGIRYCMATASSRPPSPIDR